MTSNRLMYCQIVVSSLQEVHRSGCEKEKIIDSRGCRLREEEHLRNSEGGRMGGRKGGLAQKSTVSFSCNLLQCTSPSINRHISNTALTATVHCLMGEIAGEGSSELQEDEFNSKQSPDSLAPSDLDGNLKAHDGPRFANNALSKMWFTPVAPLSWKGVTKQIEHHHLWRLRKVDATETAWNKFEPYWLAQQRRSRPSVLRASIFAFKVELISAILLLVIYAASQYALPLLMPYLIQWFTFNKSLPLWWVFVYTAAVFGASVAGSLFNFHSRMLTYFFGIRVRAAVTTLVYRKSMNVIMGKQQTTGMIVNLMSTDALVIMETLPNFMTGVLAPVQIAVTLGLLSRYIGPYGLISLAVAAVATPLVVLLAANVSKLRARMQNHSDVRLKHIKELLTAIRIIKYYAWEKPFLRHIEGAREQQLKFVRYIQLTRALLITLLTNVASIGIGLTFFFYGLDHTMTLESTFSAMTFLAMLRIPFNYLPMLLAYLGQYFNSFSRITFFALCSEIDPDLPHSDIPTEKGMKIVNATFSWETDLSIAEARYLELESLEATINQRIEMEREKDMKVELIEYLERLLQEKEYIAKLVRVLRLKSRRKAHDLKSSNSSGTELMKAAAMDEDWSDEEENVSPEEAAKYAPLRVVVPNLRDISLHVRHAQLTAIVGSVGTGKSTIGMALLGEIRPSSGAVFASDDKAYASQEPWILNTTIRDNITFGQPYEPEWYAEVIRACALGPDLNLFPASDLTEIGERGSNLSGGQRQRINVARAMYSKKQMVILDDPFSAVDANVAAHMFQNVAVGMRNAGRTVLLITNQLQFMPEVDFIAVLKGGRIVEQGTCPALLKIEDGYLKKMLSQQIVHKKSDSEGVPLAGSEDEVKRRIEAPWVAPTNEQDIINRKKGQLVTAEDRAVGNISIATYWKYYRAGGLLLLCLIFIMQALRIASRVMSGVWLSWWSDTTNAKGLTKSVYLGGYMGLVFGEALFTLLGSFAFIQFAMGAARVMHSRMLNAVARAPIFWFDQTPIGRTITRFSKDIDFVDVKLPQVVEQVTAFGFILIGVVASIAVGSPWVLILVAVAGIAFISLVVYYRPTSIQIQRLEAVSRAPIYSHLTETIEGAATIRAYRMTEPFKIANMNKIDRNNVDFIALRYSSSWYSLTQDFIGSLFIGCSTIVLILIRTYVPNTTSLGYIIFALSNMGSISSALSDFSSTITDLENKMNSAERVLEYCKISSEAPSDIPGTKPPPDWPPRGGIRFNDLTIRYGSAASKSDNVPLADEEEEEEGSNQSMVALKQITAKIKPREHIGIVGRTGAGKSTLVTALFRTTEPSSGTIEIDGVDIGTLGLFDLRSRLSIIPQTPQLFAGTVRYNLDPYDEHSDHELWMALKMVRLRDHVAALPACLYELVDEGGSNFSVGQRQLLSMARCLLKGTRVLVLDEATSSVDLETDALLQSMIRQNFQESTVLTIAHRLNTIMDSDRIMVLDAGKIVEFDTPKNLLSRPSLLKTMVEATGPETAEYLRSIAFGEISFLDALSALVEEEMGSEISSSISEKQQRPSFQQNARRQQSRLVLGYYKVAEDEALEIAQARASEIQKSRSSDKMHVGRGNSKRSSIIRQKQSSPKTSSDGSPPVRRVKRGSNAPRPKGPKRTSQKKPRTKKVSGAEPRRGTPPGIEITPPSELLPPSPGSSSPKSYGSGTGSAKLDSPVMRRLSEKRTKSGELMYNSRGSSPDISFIPLSERDASPVQIPLGSVRRSSQRGRSGSGSGFSIPNFASAQQLQAPEAGTSSPRAGSWINVRPNTSRANSTERIEPAVAAPSTGRLESPVSRHVKHASLRSGRGSDTDISPVRARLLGIKVSTGGGASSPPISAKTSRKPKNSSNRADKMGSQSAREQEKPLSRSQKAKTQGRSPTSSGLSLPLSGSPPPSTSLMLMASSPKSTDGRDSPALSRLVKSSSNSPSPAISDSEYATPHSTTSTYRGED